MSIMKELQKEITRLARKEIKKELDPVRRINVAHRSHIAKLRKEISILQKEAGTLRRANPTIVVSVSKDDQPGFWITGKGVKAMRKRLGITQAQLARLTQVSDQTVLNWENVGNKKIAFRQKETGEKLAELRGMNKTMVMELLEKVPKAK